MYNSRPLIKWPGNKYRLLDIILSKLPKGKVLIEPFVGSGAIFLNSNYESYILSDTNKDLINLYQTLQQYSTDFIKFCSKFFIAKNNTATQYYKLREKFNNTDINKDFITRAALFVYLNRHGYNGLCRYNSKNKFNVPFGRYKFPVLPQQAMEFFLTKAKKAKFLVKDFKQTMLEAIRLNNPQTILYCDPPYVPLSLTANFTNYSGAKFNLKDQDNLAKLAYKLAKLGTPVLISNHFTQYTKKIYNKANEFITFPVRRTISCKGFNRNLVIEMLALYK